MHTQLTLLILSCSAQGALRVAGTRDIPLFWKWEGITGGCLCLHLPLHVQASTCICLSCGGMPLLLVVWSVERGDGA